MIKNRVKLKNFGTHSLFGVFFLTIFGWCLLHAWCVQLQANAFLHALCAMPAAVLSGVIIHRYRQHWPIDNGHFAVQQHALKRHWDYRAMSCYLLLIAGGAAVGFLVVAGSIFLLTFAALGLVLGPWAKFSVCARHFFFSSLMLLIGAVLSVIFLSEPSHSLYYLLAAWTLLIVACSVVFIVIVIHGDRRERMPIEGAFALTTSPVVDSTTA